MTRKSSPGKAKKTAARTTRAAGGTTKKAAIGSGKKTAKKAKRTARSAPRRARQFTAKQKRDFKNTLLAMRARISMQVESLRDSSLTRNDDVNSFEDGSDTFDRMLALKLAKTEHESVLAIDNALLRFDEGTYGVCEGCSELIEVPRLTALPFATMCIDCQSKTEGRDPARRRVRLAI